jgi:hypothetical protein
MSGRRRRRLARLMCPASGWLWALVPHCPANKLGKQGTATDDPQCVVYLPPKSSDKDELHLGLSYTYSADISGQLKVESRSTHGRRVNHVARSSYLSAPHRRSCAFSSGCGLPFDRPDW